MGTVNEALALAASQIGVREEPDGSNNTPYTRWYGMSGAWCDMFMSWVLYHTGTPQGSGKGFAWCSAHRDWLARDDTPGIVLQGTGDAQPGDLMFFEWGSTPGGYDHIGMIEWVEGDTLVTIEGNVSNMVMRKRRPRWSGIPELGRPAYSEVAPEPTPDPRKVTRMLDSLTRTKTTVGQGVEAIILNGKVHLAWTTGWKWGPPVLWQKSGHEGSPKNDPGAFDNVAIRETEDGRLELSAFNSNVGLVFRCFEITVGGINWSDWRA